MKKIFFVILMFLVLASVITAQERPYVPLSNYNDEMSGQDWRLMTLSQQISLLQGFYIAYSAIWDVFIHNISDGEGYESLSDEQNQQLKDLFFVQVGIESARRRIDNQYAEPSNRNIFLRDVLLWATDKEYW